MVKVDLLGDIVHPAQQGLHNNGQNDKPRQAMLWFNAFGQYNNEKIGNKHTF